MRENPELTKLMKQDGWVTAAEARDVAGLMTIGSVHNQVTSLRLWGTRVGTRWFVSVTSLLEYYAKVPLILKRIKALGAKPNPAHAVDWRAAKKSAKAKRNG